MTAQPRIDIHDLKSVREAEIMLGDDFVAPQSTVDAELRDRRARRGVISVNRSPLARKIITFNLMALIILVAGVLYLNPSRDSLAYTRAVGLVTEAELIADVYEARGVNLVDHGASLALLGELDLRNSADVFVFDASQTLVASSFGLERPELGKVEGLQTEVGSTVITDFLNGAWEGLAGLIAPQSQPVEKDNNEQLARALLPKTLAGATEVETAVDPQGRTLFSVTTPILRNGATVGAVAMTSAAGEIDLLVRSERENLFQMFVIAILVSIGLSLVLASTIANPLADLAAAAELGRDKNSRKVAPGRIRIPDLTARPDEIGRLSGALRGMVGALYERIESNEQFAADVAHEIKNPLASLRSAVGTMRVAKRDDQREKLLDVIDHAVRRLDRLVTDISNASRLDSALAKEQEETFDLVKLLRRLTDHLSEEAAKNQIDFITDLPDQVALIEGLEPRVAQGFVNLITNAMSFCEEGDAIRVWIRQRENRVLAVVEDTGPGIPEEALKKIFKRFYSERPVGQFGDNSGLGVAFSKQIVEAHGGVIWAENIRPTDADATSEPLGARFVVGLPV